MPAVSGFVLAGGRSTRMGRDKAMLNWQGRTLLQHMTDLLAAAADTVQVVGREALPDRVPGCGPLGGILTALENSATDANLVVAVDLPILTVHFLKLLRSRLENSKHALVVCRAGSHYPLCLGVRQQVLAEVRRRLEARQLGIHDFVEASDYECILEEDLRAAGFRADIFSNINTPQDWAACSPGAG